MGRGRLVAGVLVGGPGGREEGGGGAGGRPRPPALGGASPDPRSPRSLGISSSVTLAPPVPDTVIGNPFPTGADVVLALERVGSTLRSITIIVCVSIIMFLKLMFCGPRRVSP